MEALRCPQGGCSGESCLSDQQIAVVTQFNSAMVLDFPVAHKFNVVPGYSQLQGTDLGMQFGTRPVPSVPVSDLEGTMGVFANRILRYMVTEDENLATRDFSPSQYLEKIKQASSLLDATDPEIDAFRSRGGKLILLHGTADEVVSPYGTLEYYERLVERFRAQALAEFVRFYLVPGYGHNRGAFWLNVDLLQVLDDWVVDGQNRCILWLRTKTRNQPVGLGHSVNIPPIPDTMGTAIRTAQKVLPVVASRA